MGYQSILGRSKFIEVKPEDIVMPRFFYDLNLDQIVQEIMSRQNLYDLKKFYYIMAEPEDIKYRQEVLKDLENEALFQCLADFSLSMRKIREYFNNIDDSKIPEQKRKWKLDAAYLYINALLKLYQALTEEDIKSEGLKLLREWLGAYLKEDAFNRFKTDTQHLTEQFNSMKYNIQIKKDHVIVNQGAIEDDYCRQLQEVFTKKEVIDHYYQKNPFANTTLSALEAAVLDMLKKVHTQTFTELAGFDAQYHGFVHEVLREFETEIQFYLAFCMYRKEMKEMNFHFCYPKVGCKEFHILKGYDLALARKNAANKKDVVFNDCIYNNQEKFFVITGPNQGGKTTFARAMGQILYFGRIGLAVPAESAEIPIFDNIYTHFAAEESMETGAGKLKEELLRLKIMMDKVTKNSFVIINEIFTSATSYDAYIMGKRVLEYFMDADCMGLYVTHIYELAKEDSRIGSLVASLLSEDSNVRTFRIERKKSDGKSYANTIVAKYHMTYEEIKERIKQ